jgi:O-antigen/teichoic acid export membrane protein
MTVSVQPDAQRPTEPSRPILVQASPLMLARLASSFLSFALPVYLSRHLTMGDFGTYKQFFLISITLLSVLQIGLSQSLYYFVPRDRARAGAYIAQAIVLLSIVGALCACGVMVAGGMISRLLANPDLRTLGVPLGLYTGAMLASAPLEVALTAQGKVRAAGIAYVGSDGSRAILLLTAAWAGFGLPGLAWAAAIHGGLRMGAIVTLAAGRVFAVRRPSWSTLRPHLGYSLSFAAAGFVIIATSYFPQYAVSTTTNSATFALFAVGTMQLPIIDLLYTPVSEVMMVRLASARPADCIGVFHEASARLATFFFGLAGASWALASVLIPGLFTHRFDAAVPLWMVSVLEMPIVALPLDGVLRSFAATGTILVSNLVRLALMAPLTLLGLHWFGLMGAVSGFIVSQYAGRSVMLWQAKRLLDVRVDRLLPWRALLMTAIRAGLAAAPAVLVCRFVNATPKVLMVLGAAAYGLSYFGLLWVAGEIHEALGLARGNERRTVAVAALPTAPAGSGKVS